MMNVINLAGVTAAIVGSMALALWMEWMSLRWLMRLMPGRRGSSATEPLQQAGRN